MKLNRMMFDTGAKFIADSNTKNRKYPPGTLGFISSVNNWDISNPNIAIVEVIVTRRGKKGKRRIEIDYICIPVLDIDKYNEKEKHFDYDFVHIENCPIEYSNITEMSYLDFFGWGLANINLLLKLCELNDLYNRWPTGNNHPINIMKNIASNFAIDPSNTRNAFGCLDFRNLYINSMRKIQSKLLRPLMVHKAIQSNKMITAISYVIWLYESKDIKDYDKKLMYELYCLSREENIRNRKTIIEMDERRIEENKKKKRGGQSYSVDIENYIAVPIEYDCLIDNLKKFTKDVELKGLNRLGYFQNYIFI